MSVWAGPSMDIERAHACVRQRERERERSTIALLLQHGLMNIEY